MRKNKFFLKRKNTYLHETVVERTILQSIGYVFLLGATLSSFWFLICVAHVLVNE